MRLKSSIPLTAIFAVGCAVPQNKQPNIILFLVDDMGWQDTSHPFYKDSTLFNLRYHTPNMERLAAMGVTFTNAYASPVSSPTRTSLMTGMNPAAHRVTNWTLKKDTQTDYTNNLPIVLPEWNYNGLQPLGSGVNNSIEATTFVDILRQNGYHTIHCGKAHWGSRSTPGAEPRNLGFDVNIAGKEVGGLATYLASENYGHNADGTPYSDFAISGLEKYWGTDTFITDALTFEAMAAVDSALVLDKPFYLYLSHYAVHVPLNKDERFYERYKNMGLSDNDAMYAGLVEGMDKSLGDILDFVRNRGIADNTIIIFMSDNGGLSLYARDGEQNKPLSNGKGSAYEGGVRVPMLGYHPTISVGGSRCDVNVEIADFFPTILALAGVDNYQTVQSIDGVDISELFNAPTSEQYERTVQEIRGRALYWHFPNRWIPYGSPKGKGYGTYSAILKDGYKLIYYYDEQFCELYNINEDIGELNDLSANPQYEKIKNELQIALTKMLKDKSAQIPRFVSGDSCSYPDGTKPV